MCGNRTQLSLLVRVCGLRHRLLVCIEADGDDTYHHDHDRADQSNRDERPDQIGEPGRHPEEVLADQASDRRLTLRVRRAVEGGPAEESQSS